MLSRVKGYTPEILVLGKSSRLPGSLTNEPFDSCNQAFDSIQEETPEAISFRKSMHRREEARKAFVSSDNKANAQPEHMPSFGGKASGKDSKKVKASYGFLTLAKCIVWHQSM